ncbi:hypothetical protein BN3087_690004 [Sulfurovum sp. enrichment culture clone C5]|uniref:Uncharacterized protein n=1 Tax=Sulfurovum sp. enrichment culture clone C5 TaxID=497650 RepID=A0A0S4XPM8_9BACT|nr:hypothetical protein BN3087_690004 [Sulfurovum sp. enrichment culture clone C5]
MATVKKTDTKAKPEVKKTTTRSKPAPKKETMSEIKETVHDLGEKAKEATASAKEKINEFAHDANEARVHITEKLIDTTEKTFDFFEPITHKVRAVVLGFGEVLVTIFVVVGVIAAVIGGLSDMANVGFFAGLSSMFQEMVTVVMGALVIFLLFAIKESLDKK